MHHLLPILKAIADQTRLKLLHMLLTENLCGRALSQRLRISEAAVSQHIKILREVGLVSGEKRGYWTHYTVSKERLGMVADGISGLLKRSAPSLAGCRRFDGTIGIPTTVEARNTGCHTCCGKPERRQGKAAGCRPDSIRRCHGNEVDRDENEGKER